MKIVDSVHLDSSTNCPGYLMALVFAFIVISAKFKIQNLHIDWLANQHALPWFAKRSDMGIVSIIPLEFKVEICILHRYQYYRISFVSSCPFE
jgi:hypothetical protein